MKYLVYLWLLAFVGSAVLSVIEQPEATGTSYCYRPVQVPACTPPPNWNYCNPSTQP
jgi:hypothetical protein